MEERSFYMRLPHLLAETLMIVANTPVPPVPNVILRKEILFIHLPFSAIRRRMLACAPELGQIKAMISMDHQPDRLIQVLEGDMALIDPGDVAAIHSVKRSGSLAGTQITVMWNIPIR